MAIRNYATLDPATLPSATSLERSNTTALTAEDTTPQTVRSTMPKSGAGVWYVEFVPYGILGTNPMMRVGVCLLNASATTPLGEDANSIGWDSGGNIRLGGSTLATVHTWTVDDVLGMRVDLDAEQVLFYFGRRPVGRYSLPGSSALVTPAATILAGAGSPTITPQLRMLYSSGRNQLESPPTGNTRAGSSVNNGWFEVAAGIGLFRAADRAYRDAATPQEAWPATIGGSSLSVTRTVSFWPWGRRVSRASTSLRLLNSTGLYDALVTDDARDASVRIRTMEDDTLANADFAGFYVVDGVQASDDGSVKLTLSDSTAALDVPVQNRIYLPTVDEPMIAKSWPLVIGAVRSLPLACIDATEQVYAINDGPVAGVGSIRDRGAKFSPSLGDYVLQQDGPGTVTLASIAQGAVTADVSSIGGDTPSAPVDLLAGKGDFETPSDWDLSYAPLWSISGGVLYCDADPFPGQAGYFSGVKIPLPGGVTEGETYMIRVTMKYLMDGGMRDTTSNTPTSNVRIAYCDNAGAPMRFSMFSPVRIYTPGSKDARGYGYDDHNDWEFDPASQPVVFIGTAHASRDIAIAFSNSHYGGTVAIEDIKIWKLLDHELDDESLLPATFYEAAREILQYRLGWSLDQWSADDAMAIDTATRYAGVGLASTTDNPLSAAEALSMLCNAYCVSMWQDADGKLRFTRLVDPGGEVATAHITEQDMLTAPVIEVDVASGLTTQIAARKNWRPLGDSEIVTADIGQPYTTDGGESP